MHLPTLRHIPLLLAFVGQKSQSPDPTPTDEYPAAQERRRKPRRRVDPDPDDQLSSEQLRGFAFWTRLVLVHHGKLLALGPLLGVALGYMAGVYRFSVRVSAVETKVEALSSSVNDLQGDAKLNKLMLCLLTSRLAPDAVLSACGASLPSLPYVPPPTRKP